MDLSKVFAKYTIPPRAEFGHRIASFGEKAEDYKRLTGSDLICPRKRGFIRISGIESKKFLQGQVTCDVQLADRFRVFRGAHCTPKGKIIFTFSGYCDEKQDIILETHPSVTNMAIESLEKYAPFFKISITDVSQEQQSFIMTGPKIAEVLTQRVKGSFPSKVSEKIMPRFYLNYIGKEIYALTFKFEDIPSGVSLLSQFRPIGEDLADLLLLRTGFAEVTEFTTDLFIPQMLNLDRMDFIDFKKGCYTGQEIIARAHYRGVIKRRIRHLLCALEHSPQAGDIITSSSGKTIGSIASVARSSPSNVELLAVMSDSVSEFSGLKINEETGVDGRELQLAY